MENIFSFFAPYRINALIGHCTSNGSGEARQDLIVLKSNDFSLTQKIVLVPVKWLTSCKMWRFTLTIVREPIDCSIENYRLSYGGFSQEK